MTWPLPQAEPGDESLGEGWLALVLDACPTAREALAERLAKPVAHADWWAGLRRCVSARRP